MTSNRAYPWYRIAFVDYGSFLGAIVGAIGTIVAGLAAWYGVQGQIKLQDGSNAVAEAAYLRSEIEKISRQSLLIDEIIRDWQLNEMSLSELANDKLWNEPIEYSSKLIEILRKFNFASDEKRSKYAAYDAAEIGIEYLKIEYAIREAIYSFDKLKPCFKNDELPDCRIKAAYIASLNQYIHYLKGKMKPRHVTTFDPRALPSDAYFLMEAFSVGQDLRNESIFINRRLSDIRHRFSGMFSPVE